MAFKLKKNKGEVAFNVAANLVGVCAAPTKLSKHPTDREDSLCTAFSF